MGKEKIAQIWPEWEVEQTLGKGSYGTVYKAVRKDSNIQSQAAIKVISIPTDKSEVDSLRSEGLSEEGAKTYFQGIVDDFVGEIRLMESLKGVQNIVSVEDYKVVERTESLGWDIYIRMELLIPFNTYICQNKMTERDVVRLGMDICTALELCGRRNVVHRDIKPENIFINDFGNFKLGDFGIARKLENATGGLSQKGTFNYMAPEVATGIHYDARVDQYSLGLVLYRLLNNNRLPFIETEQQLLNPNARKAAVERRIRGERMAPPCNASAQVAAVIMRACAYSPDARFADATEMKEALNRASMGVYVDDVDLDKTVSVRHAANQMDHTVRLQQQGNPVPPVQPMGSQAPVRHQTPVNNRPVQPQAPVNRPVQPQAPLNQTTPPVRPQVQQPQAPVNRPVQPQAPLNQTTPPVRPQVQQPQAPVNRPVQPQAPLNQTTPPVRPQVQQPQAPVNRPQYAQQAQPQNPQAYQQPPQAYQNTQPQRSFQNNAGRQINYHHSGVQVQPDSFGYGAVPMPKQKNSAAGMSLLVSLVAIVLGVLGFVLDSDLTMVMGILGLAVSLVGGIMAISARGFACKHGAKGTGPAILSLIICMIMITISTALTFVGMDADIGIIVLVTALVGAIAFVGGIVGLAVAGKGKK